ncbi:MAG: gliding motility-associated C-terminal domain-containing protein [Bacteroidia bacterium]|nr:gliding motility-associated C-terminal domain-containing protein [Bacteroidia bacterium]
MQNRLIILFFIQISFFSTKAQQNLVPNPSFELYDTCPYTGGQLSFAPPWFQPNKVWNNVLYGSTDYLNTCNTGGCGVPSNTVGYQYAIGGDAFAGFGGFVNIVNIDQREYLEVMLIDSLLHGKRYEFSFFLSLAEKSDQAISTIGIYLSTDTLLYSDINSFNIPVTPQVESDSTIMLSDTINWMQVKKTYTAQGGERFITIGNFRNNANTPYVQIKDSISLTAYYFIDDISVVCLDCVESESEVVVPNAFSPNGDGHNDVLRVLGNTQKVELNIYDRWGELVYSYSGENMNGGQGWNGTYMNQALDNGVFVYFVNAVDSKGKEVQLKGNVTILR